MINLILNENRYENDIRALLMAFYHGEKILVRKNMEASEEESKPDRILEALYVGQGMRLSLRNGDGSLLGERMISEMPSDRKEGKNMPV